jgi:hypothetical protein
VQKEVRIRREVDRGRRRVMVRHAVRIKQRVVYLM